MSKNFVSNSDMSHFSSNQLSSSRMYSSTPNEKQTGQLFQNVSSTKVSSRLSLIELFKNHDVQRLPDGQFPTGKELLQIYNLIALKNEAEKKYFLVSWFVTQYF